MSDNLVKLFTKTAEKFKKNVALQFKQGDCWKQITFEQFKEKVYRLSGSLIQLGIEKNNRIAILSGNRHEWVMADLAIMAAGAVSVPIYSTLNSPQIQYILMQSESICIFLENKVQYEKILNIRERLPGLKYIVVMDTTGIEMVSGVFTFMEFIENSHVSEKIRESVDKMIAGLLSKDLASIVYTSGTTGQPKGVMLTHGNFLSNVRDILSCFDIRSSDIVLSILPLSHVLERTAGFFCCCLGAGAKYGFAQSINTVTSDICEIRPTLMVAVPRLFEKIYARIMDNVRSSSTLKKTLFKWSIKLGKEFRRSIKNSSVTAYMRLQYYLADNLVYRKIRERLGGNIRFLISGGAPLEPGIAYFFEAVGLSILEGYGLTETAPVTNVNRENNYKIGSVGVPLPSVKVTLSEEGEILVKGPNVMQGYFKSPEATREVFDGEGWFKTGDIGKIDDDGFLWITDRKKEMIVTSGGKNVAPQPIESIIKLHPAVENAMVVGDRKSYICALVVPNLEYLQTLAKNMSINKTSAVSILNDPDVMQRLTEEILQNISHLPRVEQIKKIAFVTDQWSTETGELTPTLKLKRRVLIEKYKDVIEKLYS